MPAVAGEDVVVRAGEVARDQVDAPDSHIGRPAVAVGGLLDEVLERQAHEIRAPGRHVPRLHLRHASLHGREPLLPGTQDAAKGPELRLRLTQQPVQGPAERRRGAGHQLVEQPGLAREVPVGKLPRPDRLLVVAHGADQLARSDLRRERDDVRRGPCGALGDDERDQRPTRDPLGAFAVSERALHVAPERGGERIAGGRAPGSVGGQELRLGVPDEADEEVERRPFLEHDIRADGPTPR